MKFILTTFRGILIAVFILFTFQTYSQKDYRSGYIITTNNDTIQGLVEYRENYLIYRNCLFKQSKASEEVSYNPMEILGYGFTNDKHFVSRTIQEENITKEYFFQLLIAGRSSLLKFESSFYLEDKEKVIYPLEQKSILVTNDDGRFYQKNDLYKGILNWQFSDCNKAKGKINSLKLAEKDLYDIFEIYNACFETNSKSYKSTKPWSQLLAGPSVGVFMTTLNRTEDTYFKPIIDKNQFSKDKGVLGGLTLQFKSPRLSERISVSLDLFYSKVSYQSLLRTNTQFNAVSIEYDAFQIPIYFSYLINKHNLKIKPAFEIGLMTTKVLSSKTYWQRDLIQGSYIIIEKYNNTFTINTSSISSFLGVAGYYDLTDKISVYAKSRLFIGLTPMETLPSISQRTLAFNIGILYKF